MQAVRVNGHVYHVRKDGLWGQGGAGPVVVFSNSLGTDLRVWDPLLSLLPASWRIFRYDTAGHGLSDDPGPMAIERHAEDLAALLDACGIERAAFVGLSVGGLIGQALVEARPDLVSALVLCSTAARIGTDKSWNERIAAVREAGLKAIADSVMQRWFSKAFMTGRPEDLALWRAMLVRTSADAYCALCAAIRDADLTASAPAIAVPTLCIVGTEDGATPPALVRETAGLIPGARYEEIAGVGHLPCVEAPERLARLLTGFFEEANP